MKMVLGQFLIFLTCININFGVVEDLSTSFQEYKKSLFPKGAYPECTKDTEKHIMCDKLEHPTEICKEFELFEMTDDLINRITLGHNGLRNLEARRFGYEIANMNILHWDRDLEEMATQRIYRCDDASKDVNSCFIYPNITLGMNRYHVKGFPGYKRWLSAAIHDWFSHSIVNIPSQFIKAAAYTPYIEIIWPPNQFLGCAGARHNDETFFYCYYAPGAEASSKNISDGFKNGKICTDCPISRATCSQVFKGLCGLDLHVRSTANQTNSHSIILLLLASLIFFNKL